jgi:3-hydroxyisobutyrate dehydrogenase
MGSRVRHCGPVGAGHAVKALNNLMSATHLLVTSEAMIAAMEFGLDPSTVLDIVNSSSGRSGSTETKWPRFVLPETYDSGFGLQLMLKDARIALDLMRSAGVPADLSSASVELWAQAADDLDPAADHTEIARWLQQRFTKQNPLRAGDLP